MCHGLDGFGRQPPASVSISSELIFGRWLGLGFDHELQRQQGAAEIHELLKRAVELLGQPLPEAELQEDEKAPDQSERKKLPWPTLQKIHSQQRQEREREGRQLREGQQPEGNGQAGEAGEECLAKLGFKPGGFSIDQFPEARKTPDA